MMSNGDHRSWPERAGSAVSAYVSDLAAHPYAQLVVIMVCGLWFALGFATDLLTAFLSILAITLTQMVLNHQNEREADTHRRDVAMHAKLDELVIAMKGARNEFVAVEELEEAEIEQLKGEVQQAIDEAGDAVGGPQQREAAKQAVEREISEEMGKRKVRKVRSKGSTDRP
jgi:low affinity Fe/Cu permease